MTQNSLASVLAGFNRSSRCPPSYSFSAFSTALPTSEISFSPETCIKPFASIFSISSCSHVLCASWHVSFRGCLSSTLFCQKILPTVFHAGRNGQKCSGTTVLGQWLCCKVVFGLLFGGELNYNFAQARSQCEWPAGRKSYADITISFYIYMLYYDKKNNPM